MLAVVEVAIRVEKFAGGGAEARFEGPFKDDSISDHQFAVSVDLVFFERSAINVSIRHFHFAFDSFVVLPEAAEVGIILPGEGAIAFAFAGFPKAFVGSFLIFSAHGSGKGVVVLHNTPAAWSSIHKLAAVLITILVIDHAKMIEAAILEVAFLEHGFATLFRLFLWATRVCLIIALSLRLH